MTDAPTPDAPPDDAAEQPDEPTAEDAPIEGRVLVKVGEHEYEVAPAARDDFELMDDLEELSRTGDPSRTPAIMRRLLGRRQTLIALDRLRDQETGRISIDVGSEFVLALLNGLDPN